MIDLIPSLAIAGVVLIILLMIPGTRQMIHLLVAHIIWPAVLWMGQTTCLWAAWGLKRIGQAHLNLLYNLTHPRSLVFPTLENERDRKARNND